MKFQITFTPQQLVTHAPAHTTLFNAANWAGLAIDSTCGGKGTCGKCKVQVTQGAFPVHDSDHRYFSPSDLDQGWRLSCCAHIESDCVVEVPRLMTSPKAATLGYGRHVILDPHTHKLHLQLSPPDLNDQRSDWQRLREKLKEEGYEVRADLNLIRSLPTTLRANDFSITAVIGGDELIAVDSGDTADSCLGIAVDVGTTTVVVALIDLTTGATLGALSALNSQAPYGADVIARVSYTMEHDDGVTTLQARIAATINDLVNQLITSAHVERQHIYECVAVGNATMLHLVFGIDPAPIAVYPFITALKESFTVRAADVNLNLHPNARLFALPHIGAYVGADIVSGVLATGLVRNDDDHIRLYIDVGTNGEIVLGSRNRALSTAAPAGPAFEGAQIKCGMRASDGAIEGVRITEDDVELQIIGGKQKALGLCGSGLVDVAAQLVKRGLVESSGKLISPVEARDHGIPESLASRLINVEGIASFLLAEGVVITQQDLRALQFAKAAIAAGVKVLLAQMNIGDNDLHEVLLAGSFGSYINPESARAIGLVPNVPVERIVAVGNTALEGAKICLLSFREREAVNTLIDFVEYVELSGDVEFNDIFVETLAFPNEQ